MLARIDAAPTAMAAEIQENFIPSPLGPMSLRPGLEYIGTTRNNLAAKHIPFVYSRTDTAIIELTDSNMRVRVGGINVTRPAVTTAITNGTFDTNLSGWSNLDEAASTISLWETGGYMSLRGDGTNAARQRQIITVTGPNIGIEHTLNLHVTRGPVSITLYDATQTFFQEMALETGYHSVSFTPAGQLDLFIINRHEYPVLLNSVVIAPAGEMALTTPWVAASLPKIRYIQSADVVFVACAGVKPHRIERRGARTWSIVEQAANNGPFRSMNLSDVSLTASALTGLITLTPSVSNTFRMEQVGALFSITSNGQSVIQTAGAQNIFTNSILVTGTGTSRIFTVTITGVWTATVTLQRSIGSDNDWQDVETYTTNQAKTFTDTLDNQTIYYRLGVKTGAYISGTATMRLDYPGGSITGIVRITAVNGTAAATTTATAVVLTDLGTTTATKKWAEGAWSAYRGYPSAVTIFDARLWYVGLDKFWGSVVDDYNNFNPLYVGDAGPVSRSIGSGPVETLRWLKSANNLLAGGDMAEFIARSSNQDEPITPTYFTVKKAASVGSHSTDAEVVDNNVIFADKSGTKLRELTYQGAGYTTSDLSALAPHICQPVITNFAVQRTPETRIHTVLNDGTVALFMHLETEDLKTWVNVITNGFVEEAFTLPGTEEDEVYYVVRRTINSATVRYLERWAKASEAIGGLANKQADSFYYYNGVATTTITGLLHIEGATAVVWADGIDIGTKVVSGGAITLTTAASKVIVGLGYTARFKSTKLASSVKDMTSRGRVVSLGVVLANTHAQGLQYGQDFEHLDPLPLVEDGAEIDVNAIRTQYNYDYFALNGSYMSDSRLCLLAAAPRPCTVMAAAITMDKS